MDSPATRRLPPGVTMDPGDNSFHIRIIWSHGGWAVAYAVIPPSADEYFAPGYVPRWATKPLMVFLNELADEYGLPKVFVANI